MLFRKIIIENISENIDKPTKIFTYTYHFISLTNLSQKASAKNDYPMKDNCRLCMKENQLIGAYERNFLTPLIFLKNSVS